MHTTSATTHGPPELRPLLGAERRRRITALIRRQGAANVAQLAQSLGVGPNTIRRDLDVLAHEGKLVRTHGGAVANEPAFTRLPYLQVRDVHGQEKEWIAEAALSLLPPSGSIFLADGTTVQAFAMRIPPTAAVHVVTNSVKNAVRLAAETSVSVELLGGRVRPELLATDCSLASDALETLFWDTAFIGAAALDVTNGVTERDAPEAARQRKFIDRASRVIALCDSSKLGRCSYARVGPLSLVEVVVTDIGAAEDDVLAFRDAGVEVVLAGPEQAGGR